MQLCRSLSVGWSNRRCKCYQQKFEIENIYWFFVGFMQNNNTNHNKNFSMAEETVHIKGTIDIVHFLQTIFWLLPIVWNYLSAALVNMKHWSHYMAFAMNKRISLLNNKIPNAKALSLFNWQKRFIERQLR